MGHRDFEELWDAKRREYFIDRHRATFEVLANWFMEGGDLIRPDHIPIDIFLNEIPYYRKGGNNIFMNFTISFELQMSFSSLDIRREPHDYPKV